MATISGVLQRIKGDLQPFLPDDLVLQACRQVGHRWRRRQLDPLQTLHLFILQILCFNTALSHLRHLSKLPISAAGYCKARMRLPLAALQVLLRSSSAAMRRQAVAGGGKGWWCGLRAYLVDGSSTITPDTPALDKFFGHPSGQKKGCSLPVPKLLGLFDAFTGLIVETLCFPLFTHEMSQVWRVHPLLGRGDLLVGDRGFCSYVHLALLTLKNVEGCFRLHQRQIVSFRSGGPKAGRRRGKGQPGSVRLKRLGRQDQLVRWEKPKYKPRWMGLEQYLSLPATLVLRELRYHLPAKGQRTRVVTLVTTLIDPVAYPKQKIVELYGMRWQVETHLAELKTTLKMRKLKSQSVAGVQKELAVYCLVYNLVHAVMLQAARRQRVTPPERISFLDTVRWLLSARPGDEMPRLLVNPLRPDRHEPRAIKDLQDTYRKMTRPRSYLRRHPELTTRRGLS